MPIEFPMFTIMSMQFVILLCLHCNSERKMQPLATACNSYSFEDEEVIFKWEESSVSYEYRDEKYRNVYIDMEILKLICEIVDEKLDT